MAAEGLSYRGQFSNDDNARFESDWRKLIEHWKPQQTEGEAAEVARVQLSALHKLSPRRRAELTYAREAIFAAWVITLCPDREVLKQHEPELLATLSHFRVDKLRCVFLLPVGERVVADEAVNRP